MGAAAALVVELDAGLQPSHIYLHLTYLHQFPQLHVTSSWNPDARRSGVRDFLYAAWTMFLEFDWIKINSKNNLMMTRAGLSGKKTIINSIQSVTFTSFAKMWLCHCFVFLPFLRLIFNADCSSVEAFGTGGVSVSNLTGGIALISTASMNQMSVWKNLGQSKTIPVVGWNQKKTFFFTSCIPAFYLSLCLQT